MMGFLACGALAGCGLRPDVPPLAEVHGTVRLDGRPLARGTVQFVPDRSRRTKGPPGVGYIDQDGRYEISTAGSKGAVVGHHKVGVVAQADFDETQISLGRPLIPEHYNSPETSGLTAEVEEGQNNEINLELTSR